MSVPTAAQPAFVATAGVLYYSGSINVCDAPYGADRTGVTDCTAAVRAALLALHLRGGGVLYFPAGIYRFNGRILFPWTVDSGEAGGFMNSIIVQGDGSSRSMNSAAAGGTILKFYDSDTPYTDGSGHTAQSYFDVRGRGTIEICRLTMFNVSIASAVPFIRTTTPVPFIHNNAFFGRTGRTGITCDQDAIVVGGTTRVTSLADNACYFGYGGSATDNYFERIRTTVQLNTNVNSFVTERNTVGLNCGGGASDAAFVCDSGTETGGILADSICYANTFRKNIVEMVGYKYGIDFRNYAAGNKSIDNDFWDASAYAGSAYCHKVSSAFASFIEQGTFTDSCLFVDDGGHTTSWTRLGGTTNRLFALTLSGTNPLIVDGVPVSGGGILVKASTTVADYWRIGAPDISTFTITREPAVGSPRTMQQITHSAGDSSTYFYIPPPVNGGNTYFTTTNGGVGLRASGSGANLTMFGDDGSPTALQYFSGLLTANAPFRLKNYTVATLPTAGTAGRKAFATNGRKAGEGAGSGTGIEVYDDGTAWRASDTSATVAA